MRQHPPRDGAAALGTTVETGAGFPQPRPAADGWPTPAGGRSLASAQADAQAAVLADAHAELDARIQARWHEIPATIAQHEEACGQFVNHAHVIFDLVLHEMAGGPTRESPLVRGVARVRAIQRIHPRDSVQAAAVLHGIIVGLARDLLPPGDEREALLCRVSSASLSVLFRVITSASDAHLEALITEIADSNAGERRRIARELHDQIGHSIAVAQRQMEFASRVLEHHPESEEVRAPIDTALEMLVETMRGVREILQGLRQDEDIVTLQGALDEFVRGSSSVAAVQILITGDEHLLPPALRREVFLMVREALRNAQRHARARTVRAMLEFEPSRLRVRVTDDGVGLPQVPRPGSGMTSLRERAALLGGRVTWLGRPGGGTVVAMTIPVPDTTRE